jgi:hypothetical protein
MAKVSKYTPNVSGIPIQSINSIQSKTLNQISNIKGVPTSTIPDWPPYEGKQKGDEAEKME